MCCKREFSSSTFCVHVHVVYFIMQESSQHSFTQPPNYWCKQVFQETQENVGGGEVASVKLAYYRPLHVYISCTVYIDRNRFAVCNSLVGRNFSCQINKRNRGYLLIIDVRYDRRLTE